MAGRRTNLALLAALSTALATGGLAFAVGTRWNLWLTVVHGVSGLAVVALAPWKSVVVRRGLRRRSPWRALPSIVLIPVVGLTVATAVIHAVGQRDLWPVTAMQVHVGAALVALVLVAGHVVTHPQRPVRTDLSRRTALRAGGIGLGAAAAYGAVALVGAERRFTGSLETGTDEPSAMPVTQWLFDSVPAIDVDRWRLATPERTWRYDELVAASEASSRATLDCTGGWWATQDWGGVPLDRLLGGSLAGAATVEVRSATGYFRRFPATDASRLLLATRVAGQPLSPGHGSPARLVAPGRRGFWWVKWVTEITVDDRPWWWQPPFPLQ